MHLDRVRVQRLHDDGLHLDINRAVLVVKVIVRHVAVDPDLVVQAIRVEKVQITQLTHQIRELGAVRLQMRLDGVADLRHDERREGLLLLLDLLEHILDVICRLLGVCPQLLEALP